MRFFKPIEELTFSDDFMFGHILHKPDICAKLIEILLHIKVDKIEYPDVQKSVQPNYSSHGVRFDVYVKDSNRIFEIEMQNGFQAALGKRCRYYQSIIDSDNLSQGNSYKNLKESYILFLCKYDPFKLGLPIYTFKHQCLENSQADLDDKATVIIYNCEAAARAADEEVKALRSYIISNQANSEFTMELDKMVATGKFEQSFFNYYMGCKLHENDIKDEAFKEGKAEGISQGLAEGAHQNALENARNFLAEGIQPETVAKCTGLNLEEVKQLL